MMVTNGTSGERLRLARVRQGLSQEQLAARARMSPWTISEFERGKRPGTSLSWGRLALALGIELEELTAA